MEHEIFGYVESGNIEGVRRLLETRDVSPNIIDSSGRPLLIWAILRSGRDTVQLLIDHGADVNVRWSTSPLVYAIQYAKDDVILLLLRRGAIPTPSALIAAVRRKNEYIVRQIVSGGVDVNALVGSIDPLLAAIGAGDMDIITFLVEKGADVNSRYGNGMTALMIATQRKRQEVIFLLVENGARIDDVDAVGNTALLLTDNSDIANILIQLGADVNHRNNDGISPLVHAMTSRNYSMVKLLLGAKGIDLTVGYNGRSILDIASGVDPKMVEMVIDHGVRVDNDDGERILIGACTKGHLDMVELLGGKGVNVNVIVDVTSPLIAATRGNHQRIVSYLLSKDIDVNYRDADGMTALMYAVMQHHSYIVRILMDAGADVRVRDNYGGNALILCTDDDKPSTYIMRILLDAGIYIDTQDVNGMTPLMLVSSSSNLSALELLLSDGANPNIRNNKGDTALIIASRSNILENVRMLLKYGAYTNLANYNGETAYTVTSDHDIKNLLGKYPSSMMRRHGREYVDVHAYNASE